MLADVERCVGIGIGGVHEVHACEVFVRRHDVDGVLALDAHEVRKTCTRAYEDALIAFFLKLCDGDGLADYAVSMELNAHLLEVLNLDVNDVVRQTEFGDAILEHATNLVESLKDMHFISELCHLASEAQT